MNEIKQSSETFFEGRIISVHRDNVVLKNGKTTTREVVRHDPAIVVIAYQEPDIIYLVKQFRYPVQEVLLEACAGIINKNEEPLVAAKRELKEETGISANTWTKLGHGYPTPGFCDEFFHFYLAQDLSFGQCDFDEDEYVELEKLSFSEIEALIDSFSIRDSKTLTIYLLLRRFLSKNER